MQDLSGGEAKVVYTDPSPGVAVDVSPDGSRALLLLHGIGGHSLLEVDLATGTAKRLYPAEGKLAIIATAAYATDGKRAFVATDAGPDSYSVLALDTASLATLAEYKQDAPASAGVGAIATSPRGDVIAIVVDAGNHTTVRVLDAKTLAVRKEVATPLGTVSLGTTTEVNVPIVNGETFSTDGAHFVIGISRPDAPSDIYVVDTATGAMAKLRHDKRAGLDALAPMKASIEKVTAFDGLTIPVNVYLPQRSDGRTERLPTIVSFHGGPDASSTLEWNPLTRAFVAFGFAVLEPNVRGSTGFGRAYEQADDKEKRGNSMKDVASVNQWARAQSFCDPDRLVVEGASYGGYVVLMGLTRQPALWSAGVDLVGMSDLTTMAAYAAKSGQVHVANEFGDVEKDAKLLVEYSPIRDADKIVSPLFVYQGQNDTHVPRSQADEIVRMMRQRNMHVEYMVAANEGHSMSHRENTLAFLTRVTRFLHDELKIPQR